MLDTFVSVYKELGRDNLQLLREIYDDEINFIDPAHEIRGIDPLINYFAGLYANINHISFAFTNQISDGQDHAVEWLMTFSHPRLAGGENIVVPGISRLRFNDSGKVYLHRDYFDLGLMLYEQLPILGRVIRSLKRRLSS